MKNNDMKLFLTVLFINIPILFFGQNKHFTIGFNDNGLSFGNSENTNGVRINFWDSDSVNIINGINITTLSKARISNGFTLGLLGIDESVCNGIVINGFAGGGEKANGIIISGWGYTADQFNGLGIGGFGLAGNKLNGLFISPLGIGFWNENEKTKLINGATIGLCFVSTEKLNGLSISLVQNVIDEQNGVSIGIVNKSKELRGIQIGFWNIAENNKIFKRMPIINFNFRKKSASNEPADTDLQSAPSN